MEKGSSPTVSIHMFYLMLVLFRDKRTTFIC